MMIKKAKVWDPILYIFYLIFLFSGATRNAIFDQTGRIRDKRKIDEGDSKDGTLTKKSTI